MCSSNLFILPPPAPSVFRRKPLTPRQIEVVELAEYTDADIAEILGNQKKTVKCLLRQAYDRLGVDNRRAAMRVLREMQAEMRGELEVAA